jgi:hypothetical protein
VIEVFVCRAYILKKKDAGYYVGGSFDEPKTTNDKTGATVFQGSDLKNNTAWVKSGWQPEEVQEY